MAVSRPPSPLGPLRLSPAGHRLLYSCPLAVAHFSIKSFLLELSSFEFSLFLDCQLNLRADCRLIQFIRGATKNSTSHFRGVCHFISCFHVSL